MITVEDQLAAVGRTNPALSAEGMSREEAAAVIDDARAQLSSCTTVEGFRSCVNEVLRRDAEESSLVAALLTSSMSVDWAFVGVQAPKACEPLLKHFRKELRARLVKATKARSRQEHVASRGMLEAATTPVASTLPDVPVSGLVCPPMWMLGQEGTFALDLVDGKDVRPRRVALAPIVVTGLYEDDQGRTTELEIQWRSEDRWRRLRASRFLCMDEKRITTLSGHGMPVNSLNARQLVAYLTLFEHVNRDSLAVRRLARSMGWQDDRADVFLWGRTVLSRSPGGISDAEVSSRTFDIDVGADDIASALRASGDWESWCTMAAMLTAYPRVWIAVYAALVPTLMVHQRDISNFVVEFCGETSQGKTTALRIAASVWGDPDERAGGFVRSWDSTRVFLERAAAAVGTLPLIVDEAMRASSKAAVSQQVYDFASGIGRGRGTVEGMASTSRWRNVVLSSGETSLVDASVGAGQHARVLSVTGPPFGPRDRHTADVLSRITVLYHDHHGHLGPRFVRWLLEVDPAGSSVRTRYEAQLARLRERAGDDAVATRLCPAVAALLVAADILHRDLGIPEPTSSVEEELWGCVTMASSGADVPLLVARSLLSWADARQKGFEGQLPSVSYDVEEDDPEKHTRFRGFANQPIEMLGRRDTDRLCVVSSVLKTYLEQNGHDFRSITRAWAARGWLHRDGDHLTRKIPVGGRMARCYVLIESAIEGG